jgi:hypothetical protein
MEKCMLISPHHDFDRSTLAPVSDTLTLSFAEMLKTTVDLATVDLVITPLVGDGFDALEIIERLGLAKFKGRVHVTAPKLPNRHIVLRELRAVAGRKGITVDMTECE